MKKVLIVLLLGVIAVGAGFFSKELFKNKTNQENKNLMTTSSISGTQIEQGQVNNTPSNNTSSISSNNQSSSSTTANNSNTTSNSNTRQSTTDSSTSKSESNSNIENRVAHNSKVFRDGVTLVQLNQDKEKILNMLNNLNAKYGLINMSLPMTEQSLIRYVPQRVLNNMSIYNASVNDYLGELQELNNYTLNIIKSVVKPSYYNSNVLDQQGYYNTTAPAVEPQLSIFEGRPDYQEAVNLFRAYGYAQAVYENATTYLYFFNQPEY